MAGALAGVVAILGFLVATKKGEAPPPVVATAPLTAPGGEGAQPPSVLSAIYSTPGLFAVRADSPYRRIEDLKGRRVIFGARGSGLVVLARYTLDGMGLDMQRDFQAILLDRIEDAPGMLLDGRAEALWGGGAGWPPFVALARTGARFIVPDAVSTERIVARHGFMSRLVLPADSYTGQDEPLVSVGTWSLIRALCLPRKTKAI